MPLLGTGFRGTYFVTTPLQEEYDLLNLTGFVFNGVKLCGSVGVQSAGEKPWFQMGSASELYFLMQINGVLAGDIVINIEACLMGGEASPTVIVTLNPTSGILKVEEPDVAYDRVRVNVTSLLDEGKGSQILMSGR